MVEEANEAHPALEEGWAAGLQATVKFCVRVVFHLTRADSGGEGGGKPGWEDEDRDMKKFTFGR